MLPGCPGGAANIEGRMARIGLPRTLRGSMHVLFLPKWYPGLKDPQLGDFLRKQALATARYVRISVLHIEAIDQPLTPEQVVLEDDGAWELTVRYTASTSAFRPWRRMVNFSRYLRAGRAGWKRLVRERGKPQLIHAYILVRPVLLAYILWRKHRVPYLLSEQSSVYLDGTYAAKHPAHRALCRYLASRARCVTAVSAWLGDALKAHGLCDSYTVVPNVIPGIDRPLPAAGHTGAFLMVADLVDRIKNVSGVLRALATARLRDPRLRLTLIGDGPDRRMLEDLTDQMGLQQHVRFLGRLPNHEVLDHMAHAFAVVVNSHVETFSVVTGEALAQGKPVVATRCGGPQAFVTDQNGLLIPPGDDAALCDAMLTLCANADRYDPAVIRRSVSASFSTEAVGRAFQMVYERALHA